MEERGVSTTKQQVVAGLDFVDGDLCVSYRVAVSASVSMAAQELGARQGDFFAVWTEGELFEIWDTEKPISAPDAEEWAHAREPQQVFVYSNDTLWELADMHVSGVKSDCRG